MRKLLFTVLLAGAAGAANAQIKCWNEGGKRVCGDTPPPGAKTSTVATPPPAAAPAPAASKDAKKGPLTASEQAQQFRQRQDAAKQAEAKAAEERQQADQRRENCERARETLGGLRSGQRVSRFNEKGERYFLGEEETKAEIAKGEQMVKQWCN
jgi:hypothetical protein